MGVFNILSSEEKRYLSTISLSGSGTAGWLAAAALAAGNMDPLYPGKAMQMQLCRSVVILKLGISIMGNGHKKDTKKMVGIKV